MNTERKGDWIQTANGRAFWPLDPRVEDVHLDDIAYALSNQCRFSGHCRPAYSVAEHSVRASMIVPPDDALWALMHDASEAFLVDVPRPIKPFLVGYKEIETTVMRVICERFGLIGEMPESVKRTDEILLATEARDLMQRPPRDWKLREKPLEKRIVPWSAREAELSFLDRFAELAGENI
jgi:5'-deoxynucleotidase YfbR-like HD superfamily hydrolase